MQFVVQSFAVPANSLVFSSTRRAGSVSPDSTDDSVGLEDAELVVLTLVAVTDPSEIVFTRDSINITITDNDSRCQTIIY